MPVTKIEYKCLLISPSDVLEERKSLSELVNSWNAHIGDALGARVDLVKWESHALPEFGEPAQSLLNKQLVYKCDFGVAIFWSKLGSPTEEYPSGSVEEIYRLVELKKPVIVYFCTRPIPQDSLKNEQYFQLQKIKNKFESEGLLASFDSISNLKEQFQLHLTSQVSQLLKLDKNFQNNPQILTAAKPDVRVKVDNCVGLYRNMEHVFFLSVSVENHSPIPVYLGNIYLKKFNTEMLYVMDDSLTGERQHKRKLEPGESFSFNITLDRIVNEIDNVDYVIVKDDIGRIYESDKDEFKKALETVIRDSKIKLQKNVKK